MTLTPYWLPGDLGCIKIAYAASSRSDLTALSKEQILLIKTYLSNFAYIGVRDEASETALQQLTANIIHLNCDPTFLGVVHGDHSRGKDLIKEKFNVDFTKPIIGVMVDQKEDANTIINICGKEYDYISLYRKWPNMHSNPSITPFEWVDIIAGVDFFITAFYHGMCFAMINNTPFIAVEKNVRAKDTSKCEDLLRRTGLGDRYCYSLADSHESVTNRILNECGKEVDFRKEIKALQSEFEVFLSDFRVILGEERDS